MGEIKDQWLSKQDKVNVLEVIDEAKDAGISVKRTCTFLMINRRRVTTWRCKKGNGDSLANLKPGPRKPFNRLLPMERAAVLEMAKKEEYADLSHRVLAVMAWDLNIFFVSFSSVYRILRSENMATIRGNHRQHNGCSIPPVRKELTGPNQR
ncbi:MAG: hypothetical protein R6T98_09710 [Desulfatiglandales bacterium]